MKTKALLFVLFVAGIAASYALAGPPPGHGHGNGNGKDKSGTTTTAGSTTGWASIGPSAELRARFAVRRRCALHRLEVPRFARFSEGSKKGRVACQLQTA